MFHHLQQCQDLTFMEYKETQLSQLYSMMPQQALKTLRLFRTKEMPGGPLALLQTRKVER